MEPWVVESVIGVGCALLGAFFGALLPTHFLFDRWFNLIEPSKKLVGTTWDSSWWRPNEPTKKYHETLVFTRQSGDQVWARSTREEEPDKLWECAGRYDGRYLQLYYWPSRDSPDSNFLDYGCYFLVRQGDGRMVGYSSGHGPDEESQEDILTSDNHLLQQRRDVKPAGARKA